MNETIETIMQWHKETFPNATLEGQIKKFFDEKDEFYESFSIDSNSYDVDELADMFIVLCGMARFCLHTFFVFMDEFSTCLHEVNTPYSYLRKAIERKMRVNRQRQWNEKDGQYQHKED